MTRIESSLDWQEVKLELLRNSLHTKLISYVEISKMIRNLDEQVKKLGNEEIHARTTGKDRRAKEMVESINSAIETFEYHLLMETLSR